MLSRQKVGMSSMVYTRTTVFTVLRTRNKLIHTTNHMKLITQRLL
jgi:hypothetical protein